MTKPNLEDVKNAIKVILQDTKAYQTSLNWAVNYCRYALEISDEKEMQVQVLYILSNITSWRNEKAKEVRAVLKAYKN